MSDDRLGVDGEQWDPLAPVVYRDEMPAQVIDEAAPVPTDSPSVAEEPEPEETGDGGFSDGFGVSRVWFEDGKLVRLRVSANWRARLAEESVSLADCINAAILAASLEMGHEFEAFDDEVPESDLIEITSRAQADRLIADLVHRQEVAVANAEGETSQELPTTRAHAGGVTAMLDGTGRLMQVELAEGWLVRSEVAAINNAVVAAAHNAYREFVPTEQPARAELRQLVRELNVMQASYLAWINRGDWR